MRRFAAAVIAGGALSAGVAWLDGQAPEPADRSQSVFRTETTLVPMDVRVVDRAGQPVTDLRQSDFTIVEDGVRQTIAHFSTQPFTPDPAALSPAGPPRASDAFEIGSVNRRTFLLVIGRGRLQAPAGGVDALLHLVRTRLMPQDYVAVLGWNRATDFTTDRASTIEVLERVKKGHLGIETATVLWEKSLARIYSPGIPAYLQKMVDDVFGGPRASNTRHVGAATGALDALDAQTRRAALASLGNGPLDPIDQVEFDRAGATLDDFMSATTRSFMDVSALYAGIEYLRQVAGDKHLIFVSEFGLSLPSLDDDRSLARVAADARVTLSVIHSGGMPFGLSGPIFSFPPSPILSGQTARTLAGATGGQFLAHRQRNATADIDLIEGGTRFAYVLGYYPTKTAMDGRFRNVRVTVNRPGLTVLARNGYFARSQVTPIERRGLQIYSRVAAAARHPATVTDLAIPSVGATLAAARNGQRALDVTVTIDLSRAAFTRQGGRNVGAVDLAVFAVTRNQQTVGQWWNTLELSFADARLAEVRKAGLVHRLSLPVTAPPREVKVVVYDYGADLTGSAVAAVTDAPAQGRRADP